MRVIEATFPSRYRDQVTTAVAGAEPVDWRAADDGEDGRCVVRVTAENAEAQAILDRIQSILTGADKWRVNVIAIEATAPKVEEDKDKESEDAKKKRKAIALREEIYQSAASGARFNVDFVVLTLLSALVAAVGLNADNVAVVIGAMVIAPLLGPLMAFSFAGALGDLNLMARAARTAAAGVGLVVAAATVLGMIIPVNLASRELISRTDLGLDSTVLALASGAAAALSILTGLSSALVGVMVAVALAPPAVAAGLLLGAGETGLAASAAVLLALNIVCVNLSAQAVYAWKGVRPRTWLEQRSAKRSLWINLAVWASLVIALTVVIVWSNAQAATG